MASHHHCHNQNQQTHHQSTCYSSCCCSCSSQSQPQLSPTDPLVQAIASQLLQQQTHQQQHLLFTHQYLQKPQYQYRKPKQHYHHHQDQDQEQSHALITSLLRRIDALESSLQNLSPTPSHSLRHFAARTIQTHFRAYLVRRSRTLRHLKHLAIIKSTLNALKSSISDKPHFNSQALSQKAMDLLQKLDSIQGGDPMIRDGKRSISRELVRLLEFIDGVSMKRQQLYSKAVKKVRFAEANGESRVRKGSHEPCCGEDVGDLDDQAASSDDQREVMENLCEKIENIEGFSRVYENDDEEEEAHTETEGTSPQFSNGERNPRNNLKGKVNYGNGSHSKGQNGNPLFSAPLPVQMEPLRDDLMKREKIVRVAR